MVDKFDIVIVGAGAVGLSAAVQLAQSTSYRILLIDRRDLTQSAATGRSIALSFSSERYYQQLGLWPTLIPEATAIQQVHNSVQGHFGTMRLMAADYHMSALGQVLPLDHLENSLKAELTKYPQVTLAPKTQLENLTKTPMPQLTLVNATARYTVTADLVIGTDGAMSQVAKSAGITYKETAYRHHAVISHIKTARHHQHIAYERFTQSGAMALLPFGEQQMTFVWTRPDAEVETMMTAPPAVYLQQGQAAFGQRLGRWLSATKRVSYPLVQRIATRQWDDNIVLLGNSAHTLHPIAAQGLNLSLRDIDVFCRHLQSMPTLQSEQARQSAALAYEQQVKPDQQRIIRFTNQIAKQVSGHWMPGCLKATLLQGIELCAPIKHRIARIGMGLQPC